jgi:DNA-binding SARP family transcriptional activator
MLHAGLDLSRRKLDVCLLSNQGEHLDQLVVPPDVESLRTLARRIDEAHQEPVCAVVESMTGARLVHDTLEREGWDVEIADAQRVKGLARLACKTDKTDSLVLATLSQRDLVPAIWLPDPQVREVRELARFRLHLVHHKSALKNRIHSTMINFGRPCPVTGLFGVEGRRLLAWARRFFASADRSIAGGFSSSPVGAQGTSTVSKTLWNPWEDVRVGTGQAAHAAPAQRLRIVLLGALDIVLGDRPITIDAPRLQSLLAYLLLNRGAQPRERLAFTFWPDSTDPQARTNLRQALHLLRRVLPESDRFLEIDPRSVSWRADGPFSLDVEEFERMAARAEAAREAGETGDERSALEAAVALYGGDLLPGCYDEWIAPERQRLRELFLRAAERLAELLELERDYRGAIPWARRLLEDDAVNEDACRRLMRLHALSGNRAGALRAYHGCATALVRELGVTPSAATQEMYERLLESEPSAAPHEPESTVVGASPLVGRGNEWEALHDAWKRASNGESLLAVVSGEAGVGKSRLAQELLGWVEKQGFAAAGSRCYSAAGSLAYAPVVELLRSQAIGPRLRHLDDPWLAELARLMPELATDRPELLPASPLIDDWQRARLLDALSHAILADERPLLLVIDDLQWCDRDTLGWIDYLLASKPRAPRLVVATARSEELDPVQPLLHAARTRGQAVELELAPLRATETAVLAANVWGRKLDEQREELLYRETEGNPLFVVEWVRAGLVEAAPESRAGGEPDDERELPPMVHSVIQARLGQLSPAAQELASLAATVGRAFTFDVMALASSSSEEQVIEALDELWNRRIVRERGVDAYDFSHDRLREAAYLSTGSARRRMLHRRVAQALERLHAADLDGVSSELAAHYERAGWTERAIDFYARSAEVAQRVYSNEGAIELFSRALELLDTAPATRQRDERELALRTALGAPLVANKGYGASEVYDVYLRAWELCERLETRPDPPVLRALALVSLAWGELPRAYELGEQLLQMGEREDQPMVRVEGNYVLGVTSFWLGDFATARDQLERAIAGYLPDRARSHLALYSQDPRVVCMSRFAYVLHYLGHPDQAEAKAREALRLADELEHPFSRAYALTFSAWLAIDLGDEARARERAARLAALAEEQRLGFLQPMGAILRGWMLAGEGRTDEAIARIREGLDAYTSSGWSLYQPYGLVLLGRVCLDAGRTDEGRAAVSEALELTERIGQQAHDAQLHLLMGELILASGGNRSDAESHYSSALEIARRQRSAPFAQRAAASLQRLRGKADGTLA